MPPAVDIGLPPTIIKKSVKILLAGVKAPMSYVAKPAVLGVMLWNKLLIILSQTLISPMVEGLFHSKIINKIAGINISAKVVQITSLLWKEIFDFLKNLPQISKITM